MARIRSVKPELRTSKVVGSWPYVMRYFWVLLWGYLDDYGRGHDLPKAIAGDCFPDDDKITARVVDGWLDLMAPVCRYQIDGHRYIHCRNWREHQRPNRPTRSRIPPCPLHEPGSETFSEPGSEPLHVGAAAGSSRGAGEQQQGRREPVSEPPPSAAVTLLLKILEAEGITSDEAAAVAERVQRERKPRNLPGLLRTIAAAGELPALLEDARRDAVRAASSALLAKARRGPSCPHGEPGGAQPHPATGQPLCPLCRTTPAAAFVEPTTEEPDHA